MSAMVKGRRENIDDYVIIGGFLKSVMKTAKTKDILAIAHDQAKHFLYYSLCFMI